MSVPTADATWAALVTAAAQRYPPQDAHARRFARSKLRRDGAFRTLFARGLIPAQAHVLDLGCGQGLLAVALAEAQRLGQAGAWPRSWPAAPLGAHITGVDRLGTDISRARAAAGAVAQFVCGDMRTPPAGRYDVVVFLDTLHYLAPADQLALLARVRELLAPAGTLLLRVHDDAAPWRAAFGRWVDRATSALHGGGFAPVHGRPVAEWCAELAALGLHVTTQRVDGRWPFVNRLIVATAPGQGGVRA